MALVNVDNKWVSKLNSEIDNIGVYTTLIGIIHSMMEDDSYTVDGCFADLVELAEEVRSNIDERKFPLKGLQLNGDSPEPLRFLQPIK